MFCPTKCDLPASQQTSYEQPLLRPHFVNWLHIIFGLRFTHKIVCPAQSWICWFMCRPPIRRRVLKCLSKTEDHIHYSCTQIWNTRTLQISSQTEHTYTFSMQIEKRRLNLQTNLCGHNFYLLIKYTTEIESWFRHTLSVPMSKYLPVIQCKTKTFSCSGLSLLSKLYAYVRQSSDVGQ